MNKQIHIVSTASLSPALLEKALDAGISIAVIPFISTKTHISDAAKKRLDILSTEPAQVVFTSVHAVHAVQADLKNKPAWSLYCLSGATGDAAASYFGSDAVVAEAAGARELALKIAAGGRQRIIFFCGNRRLDVLPALLREREIEVEEIEVYQTLLTPSKIDRPFDGLLFFSPSAVESFFEINRLPAHAKLFAIGETTAAAIEAKAGSRPLLPATQSRESMIDLIIQYYHEHA